MGASPYQLSRQQSQQPPSSKDLPGLAILLNYPPGALHQDMLALAIPIYLMFTSDHEFTDYAKMFLGDSASRFNGFDNEIFVMVPIGDRDTAMDRYFETTDNKRRLTFVGLMNDIKIYRERGTGGTTYKLFAAKKNDSMSLGSSFIRASD